MRRAVLPNTLEVGLTPAGEVVVNHPAANAEGHIIFSAEQAYSFAALLAQKAAECYRDRESAAPMLDKERGLYSKYFVSRLDGSSRVGRKHNGCRFFVLDLDHDPNAAAGLEGYAFSCAEDFPELAKDLRAIAAKIARK